MAISISLEGRAARFAASGYCHQWETVGKGLFSAVVVTTGMLLLMSSEVRVRTDSRTGWIRPGAAAGVLVLAAALGPVTAAEAAVRPVQIAPQAPLAVNEARGSVAYLRQEYGISASEALRRLELQRTSREVDAMLARDFPNEYAGMWLDQATGGALGARGLETNSRRVAAAVRSLPDRGHVRVESARWSLRDLQSTQQRLDQKLNVSSPVAEVAVDVVANTVAVYQRAGAATVGASSRTGMQADAAARVVE